MPLNTTALYNGILDFLKPTDYDVLPEQQKLIIQNKASILANAINGFVQSGDVTFTSGKVTGVTMVQGSPVPLANGTATLGKMS